MSLTSPLKVGVKRSADEITNSEDGAQDISETVSSNNEEQVKRKKVTAHKPSISIADVEGDNANDTKVENKSGAGFGFLAYSKTNPFAAALLNVNGASGFGSKPAFGSTATFPQPSSLTSTESVISVESHPSSSFDLGSSFQRPQIGQTAKSLTVETKTIKPIENKTPLSTPSPKTEKVNPFSSISPKLNPFVKIMDSKEEPFLERAVSSSSTSNSKSVVAGQSKSFFSTFKEIKAASNNTTIDLIGHDNRAVVSSGSSHNNNNQNDESKSLIQRAADDDEIDGDNDQAYVEEEASGPVLTNTYNLPENVVIVTGEENETCLQQLRAKLFRWVLNSATPSIPADTTISSTNSDESPKTEQKRPSESLGGSVDGYWVEVGIGPVRLLRERQEDDSEKESDNTVDQIRKSRIVMRREERKGGHGTKLLLNIPLQSYVLAAKQGDKAVRITCVHPEMEGKSPTPQVYVLKCKTVKEADDLFEETKSCIEQAKSVGY